MRDGFGRQILGDYKFMMPRYTRRLLPAFLMYISAREGASVAHQAGCGRRELQGLETRGPKQKFFKGANHLAFVVRSRGAGPTNRLMT